ncbi:MAG TPA: UDP-3-O-(3-hydroxymyristoyl)glucosamine N-acyltransferase [Verrucomicrobiae bacterium]|nr:UDP-3-O-(3-hydroxymyristoyl)glucosamine N-acyltransferase [Verrucomicrobiae bacterium]
MFFTASQIAKQLQGEIVGDGSVQLTGLAPAEHARSGELTFAENAAYFAMAEQSQAAAILVAGPVVSSSKVLIRVLNPRVALARVLPLFFPPEGHPSGIHPSAVIPATARVDATAHIGPNCVLGDRVRLGARCVLIGGNSLGADCQLGDDVCLFPNVVLYRRTQVGNRVSIHAGTVIGSDGFGYVLDEGRHRKVLQLGNVIIQDDVEIGANAAIDRATFGPTVIGQGTKIDNLVHIAHNVVIGRHCLIMGQVGFAGSTHLGDYVVVASQSGVADHLKLGNQVIVGAKSGVMRDVADGGRVLGIPACSDRQAKRQMIAIQQLPEMLRRLRKLEEQVRELTVRAA